MPDEGQPGGPAAGPLVEATDAELLTRYRAGEDAAFELLVERYRTELFRFLAKFVNNRAVAEDLFQETFLQVHLSADTFDSSKRLKPWLFTIAANKARDWLRRNRKRRHLPLNALVDAGDEATSFVDLMQADLPLPTEVAQDRETAERVREAVDQMPDHLREVLWLAYFNQFAYKEIAEMLSIPLGTVKSRLHSAVGTFAELWKQNYAAGGPSEGDPPGDGEQAAGDPE